VEERIEDRALGRVDDGVEEVGDVRVGEHLHAREDFRLLIELARRKTGVARREREEEVAARLLAAAAHARDTQADALRQPAALVREERRVGRGDADDRTGALVVAGQRDVVGRDRLPVHAQPGAAAVVRLHEDADRVAVLRQARGGPDPAFEAVADHPCPAPDVALRDGAAGRGSEGLLDVLGPHVHPVYVVQDAVPGLADDGERPEALPRPPCGAPADDRVADDADAVRVRQPDRRGQEARLVDPRRPRQLAVAVQAVPAGEARELQRDDYRDARARPPFGERRVAHEDAVDVRDRVVRAVVAHLGVLPPGPSEVNRRGNRLSACHGWRWSGATASG
jgi:hypothetical protein